MIRDIVAHTCSLVKLKTNLDNPNMKVMGVSYDNTLLSSPALIRPFLDVKKIDTKEKYLHIGFTARLSKTNLVETDTMIDFFIRQKAGDAPGVTQVGEYGGENVEHPETPEPVSVNQALYSIDLELFMDNPTITYREFKVGGTKFIKFVLAQTFEETGVSHSVEVLFAEEVDKMYLLSSFSGKKLTVRDTKMILDLVTHRNLTGRAIIGVKQEELRNGISTASSYLFPMSSLVTGGLLVDPDELALFTDTGYIRLSLHDLSRFNIEVSKPTESGGFTIKLTSKTSRLTLFIEA